MKVLLPLAWLYGLVMYVRNKLFDWGLLRSQAYDVAVIGVGNLAVGGTGKTPHTEYLLRLLHSRFRTATLSRGYGRKTKGFLLLDEHTTAADGGDEPCQMRRKFPDVSVSVCEKRTVGMDALLSLPQRPEAVVLDDNYQHRYVKAGLQILLTDYHRLYSQDSVMPAGRLRECRRGARRADIIIVTKCPATLSHDEADYIKKQLRPRPHQQLFFTTLSYGTPYRLQDATQALPEPPLDMVMIAGIAHPEPLRDYWAAQGTSVRLLRFPDHHTFTPAEARAMNEAFDKLPAGRSIVLTTEKDAERLRQTASLLTPPLLRRLYVQPVEVSFLFGGAEVFDACVLDFVSSFGA